MSSVYFSVCISSFLLLFVSLIIITSCFYSGLERVLWGSYDVWPQGSLL